jgi:site-specific recombinase XerD
MLPGAVRISRAVTELRNRTLVIGDPKIEAGRRLVSIPPHLTRLVEGHLKDYVRPEVDAVVLTNSDGSRLRERPLRYHWTRAREAVGVSYNIHDLRHLGAMLAAMTGASTRELMRRIGHASPAAALRYQHATNARDEVIAAALSEIAMPNVSRLKGVK